MSTTPTARVFASAQVCCGLPRPSNRKSLNEPPEAVARIVARSRKTHAARELRQRHGTAPGGYRARTRRLSDEPPRPGATAAGTGRDHRAEQLRGGCV